MKLKLYADGAGASTFLRARDFDHIWYTDYAVEDAQQSHSGRRTGGKRVQAFFFRTEAGGEPVREWLKSLPSREDRKRIGEDIKTVEFGLAAWNAGARPWRLFMRCGRTWRKTGIARVLFYFDKHEPNGALTWVHQERLGKLLHEDLELALAEQEEA